MEKTLDKGVSNNILLTDHICTIDKCGNVYFALRTDPTKLFDITITKDNSLVCDRYIESNDNNGVLVEKESDIVLGELKPFEEGITLREKIIKEKKAEEDEDDCDSDKDEENEDIQKKYFPEDLEYNEYIDVKVKTKEPYFAFSMIDENLSNMIVERETIPALYETIVYEGDFKTNRYRPIIKTTLINDLPLYRLCVFTCGYIKFRPIGSKEKIYQLDEKMQLILK